MKKRYAFFISIAVLFLITLGCLNEKISSTSVDNIDKSTRITSSTAGTAVRQYNTSTLEYIKDSKMYSADFDPDLRPALSWLKANSEPGDKVLSWWENGHMIRGYARREPLAYTPCASILKTFEKGEWDEETMGELADPEYLSNIAYALLTDSPTITTSIMNKYGASWVFLTKKETKKLEGMTLLIGETPDMYLDDLGEPNAEATKKVLFKMVGGWPVKGFIVKYEDQYAVIYKKK